MPKLHPNKRMKVTYLMVKGSICGDSVKVSVNQIGPDKCRLQCTVCGRKTNVAVFGGKIDEDALKRMDEGVAKLHKELVN